MALAIRRGHEHADIGYQDFGLRVTEETLGRSAEGQHFSQFVDDDPRIGNSRQDGAKMRLAVAQSALRSEEHTSELQSLMRSSYDVYCLQQNHKPHKNNNTRE